MCFHEPPLAPAGALPELGLVRPMTRLVAIACAAASFSCQSESSNYPPEPSHALRIHFPKIIVRGAHADTLTVDDLRQIRDAARKRRDINLPISFVYVEAPNHVRVVTENSRVVNHTFYEFEFTVTRSKSSSGPLPLAMNPRELF